MRISKNALFFCLLDHILLNNGMICRIAYGIICRAFVSYTATLYAQRKENHIQKLDETIPCVLLKYSYKIIVLAKTCHYNCILFTSRQNLEDSRVYVKTKNTGTI